MKLQRRALPATGFLRSVAVQSLLLTAGPEFAQARCNLRMGARRRLTKSPAQEGEAHAALPSIATTENNDRVSVIDATSLPDRTEVKVGPWSNEFAAILVSMMVTSVAPGAQLPHRPLPL